MEGKFGDNGQLLFEVELVASTGEHFAVDALLDTGFTTGFLAISSQDLIALQSAPRSRIDGASCLVNLDTLTRLSLN